MYYLYNVKVKNFFIGNLFALFLVLIMTGIVTFKQVSNRDFLQLCGEFRLLHDY